MDPNSLHHHNELPQFTDEERQMAMFCHLSAYLGLILPFGSPIGSQVLWQMKKEQSSLVDFHGEEALNFDIIMALVWLICFVLVFIAAGFILLPALKPAMDSTTVTHFA